MTAQTKKKEVEIFANEEYCVGLWDFRMLASYIFDVVKCDALVVGTIQHSRCRKTIREPLNSIGRKYESPLSI